MARLSWTRGFHFKAIHMLKAEPYAESLHGHDFTLYVEFEKWNHLQALQKNIQSWVNEELNDQDLSMKIQPATGENILSWIHENLTRRLPELDQGIFSLRETAKNRFRIPGLASISAEYR